ncbi:PREDICTED: SPRY domain-containing protein 7 [Galeopterus variegatus]|uniref:SPRY domain-containing protein 7 n=1 Tax=Galeopterus variegatus TaxID=482537 RepID=A0ABM0RV74_GALVR|nr:PREDICTED: SPRY domain-containing protein 7 [Galeopterus variegatus]
MWKQEGTDSRNRGLPSGNQQAFRSLRDSLHSPRIPQCTREGELGTDCQESPSCLAPVVSSQGGFLRALDSAIPRARECASLHRKCSRAHVEPQVHNQTCTVQSQTGITPRARPHAALPCGPGDGDPDAVQSRGSPRTPADCTWARFCVQGCAAFSAPVVGSGGVDLSPLPQESPPGCHLPRCHMSPGTDVVIVKNGRRICGTGGCLASAPLHQNKSYFEFKIQSTGIWGIGVATQKVNLNQIPLGRDVHSLVMRNDGALYHNNEEKNRLPANSLPQEGDVVGITYDHVELNVYLNGKNMHCPASGIRGTVYPVVYVDDSAILDCQFSEFYHTPPPGFEKILFEQQIF